MELVSTYGAEQNVTIATPMLGSTFIFGEEVVAWSYHRIHGGDGVTVKNAQIHSLTTIHVDFGRIIVLHHQHP